MRLQLLIFARPDVDCGRMISDVFSDFQELVTTIWRYRPVLVLLVAGGFVIFLLVVIDTHRHRKKQKGRHKKRH